MESLSGIILIWRLRQHGRISEKAEEQIERRAMRFVAATFFILAAYILYQSIDKLVSQEIPDPSLPGMAIAAASLIIMPVLAYKKQSLGRQIDSKALIADSKETIACAALSFALLAGLGANYFLGLWQADPAVGLIIVLFLIREGWEGWNDSDEEEE